MSATEERACLPPSALHRGVGRPDPFGHLISEALQRKRPTGRLRVAPPPKEAAADDPPDLFVVPEHLAPLVQDALQATARRRQSLPGTINRWVAARFGADAAELVGVVFLALLAVMGLVFFAWSGSVLSHSRSRPAVKRPVQSRPSAPKPLPTAPLEVAV